MLILSPHIAISTPGVSFVLTSNGDSPHLTSRGQKTNFHLMLFEKAETGITFTTSCLLCPSKNVPRIIAPEHQRKMVVNLDSEIGQDA